MNTHFALKEPVIPGFAATATTFGSMLMNISRDIFNRWTHQIDTHRHRECALEHTGLHLNIEGVHKLDYLKKKHINCSIDSLWWSIKNIIFPHSFQFIQIAY